MFFTLPAFESPMPPPLMEPGGRSWRAIELASRRPWYIVTVDQRDGDVSCKSDMLLCWERDLITLVTERAGDVSAIHFVEPPSWNCNSAWRTRLVRRLWVSHAAPSPVAIFEDESGTFCVNLSTAALGDPSARVLLFDLKGQVAEA